MVLSCSIAAVFDQKCHGAGDGDAYGFTTGACSC